MLDIILSADEPPVSLHAQILAIEDRHGFSPAAMLKLRWRIVNDELAAQRQDSRPKRARSAKAQTAGLASRLRAVPPPMPPPPATDVADTSSKPKPKPRKRAPRPKVT
jgi:hypothetical protein